MNLKVPGAILFALFCIGLSLNILGQKSSSASEQHSRPNIILIMSDDMGYECLAANGSLSYQTPNLDKLAENGMRFTHCHSQPLCTPSRVKIMTGRYNSNNYVDFGYLDVQSVTFGNILQDAGYKTMIAGKWQLNGVNTKEENCMDPERPYQFGFDEYCLWWLTEKGSRYANPRIVQNGKSVPANIDDYGPDIVSDYIIDFISRNKGEPFFVYYPMMLVHSPFQPTPDSPEWKNPENRLKNNDKFFKDMVEYSDKIVGKIVARLEKERLMENTILIFTGDNGTNSDIVTETINGPYQGGKGRLLDNGTHVPLVISYPNGEKTGVTAPELVEFSDFLPTFAEAAGVNTPTNIDGRSFYKLLTSRRYKARESIFVHYFPDTRKVSQRAGCFIRTEHYKLYSDGRFFNLESDKWEEDVIDLNSMDKPAKKVYRKLYKELGKKPVWDFTRPHRE